MRRLGLMALVTAITLSGCGGGGDSPLSTAQVEREVARQMRESGDKQDHVRVTARCARVEDATRTFRCRVQAKVPLGKGLGGGDISTKPQNVTAVVSDDGKNIVVEGL